MLPPPPGVAVRRDRNDSRASCSNRLGCRHGGFEKRRGDRHAEPGVAAKLNSRANRRDRTPTKVTSGSRALRGPSGWRIRTRLPTEWRRHYRLERPPGVRSAGGEDSLRDAGQARTLHGDHLVGQPKPAQVLEIRAQISRRRTLPGSREDPFSLLQIAW